MYNKKLPILLIGSIIICKNLMQLYKSRPIVY